MATRVWRPLVWLGAVLVLLLAASEARIVQARDDKAPAPLKELPEQARFAFIQRAQIWVATTIPEMDLRLGPQDDRAFKPGETVDCEYVVAKLDGASPKFDCRLEDGQVVRVKYGLRGEVQGEMLATRLLWSLGFGADRMYPVIVRCHGCSKDPWADRRPATETNSFDPAVIEHKAPGHAIETKKVKGWAWPELDMVNAVEGGAPIEQRDALKLLAVFIQHSDSKPEQQRLVCLSKHERGDGCDKPFMLLNDVGQTFGKANSFNRDNLSSVNFDGWSKASVWEDGGKDTRACVGRISKSTTGTLDHPKISEQGRAFLAGLLAQLTDAQLHDLFEVARVELRSRKPGSGEPPATVDEWVAAFKHKRDEVVTRRCGA